MKGIPDGASLEEVRPPWLKEPVPGARLSNGGAAISAKFSPKNGERFAGWRAADRDKANESFRKIPLKVY